MPSLPLSFLREPIVHRGLHDAANGVQENSRASFEAAIKNGYGIELDLQMSSDGEAMVFHDYALDRVTDMSGPIQMRTATELRNIKLNGCNEGIMDLSQVLELVNGRAPLLIELKDQDGALGPNVGRLERRVAEITARYKGEVALMSFNPHSVKMLSEFVPDIPRGLTTSKFSAEKWPLISRQRADMLAEISDFDRSGSCFVSHDHRSLDTPPIKALKVSGVPIICWTVRSATQEAKARLVADNITFEGYIPASHPQAKEANA